MKRHRVHPARVSSTRASVLVGVCTQVCAHGCVHLPNSSLSLALKSFFKKKLFSFCVYVCLPVCMHRYYGGPGALGGQKRALNVLKLEFPATVSCRVGNWELNLGFSTDITL